MKRQNVSRGVDIKKKAESKEEQGDQILSGSNKDVFMGSKCEKGDYSSKSEGKPKRISSHVEAEDLWKLKRCLVGEMVNVCSVESILRRLQGWRCGEIKVQRLGVNSTYSQ
ncbi:hypothetical protein V6N13_083031 [Hibiscus sabdariffa]